MSVAPIDLTDALQDQYRLDRELGGGGMATVYLAHDLKHDRPVALKVLRADLGSTIAPERFLREIHLAARLQHPHILSVYESGQAAGRLWFTMPYIEGESLRERLAREGQLATGEAIRIACEVASALDCAHEQGVLHRDIKPENILLTRRGDVLVADFGIARALTGDADGLTQSGAILGTPAYMSPEQAGAEAVVDARSDVYGLACVLYEMLAGEPPYTGPTARAVMAKRFHAPVPSVRHVRPEVSAQVDDALHRALAVSPSDRFASMADFGRALVAPALIRRRMRVATRAMLLGFLLGIGALFAWRRIQRPPSGGPIRLAVLPFESMGDTSERAFADGMSEELVTRLARVPGLTLVGRSSALAFRASGRSAADFGKTLRVDYVLDGTVRSARAPGGVTQVRITPELIKSADGTHVWGEPYEGALVDVFRLQSEVAQRVAESLRGRLGRPARQRVRTAPTADVEAYRLYLLGRAEWRKRIPAALEQAAGYFQQAITRDPTYARAYAGLADAYLAYGFYGVPRLLPDTASARATWAARRAIALDSTLAEAHASLGAVLRYTAWDWTTATRELQRAIELDPNYAIAHQWYAEQLWVLGRLNAALEEARIALQLDPLAPTVTSVYAYSLAGLGHDDEARAAFRTSIGYVVAAGGWRSVSPNFWRGLYYLDLRTGRSGDAIGLLDSLGETSAALRAAARAVVDSAQRPAALRLLAQDSGIGPWPQAVVYATLGAVDSAFAALDRAVTKREWGLERLRAEPAFAPLQADPRYAAILRRMGLTP